jgi:hypothetical protein
MFDTTLIEKITSLMLLFTLPMVGLAPALMGGALFLITFDVSQSWPAGLAACLCLGVGGFACSLAVILILWRSRSGRARVFLEAVAAENGAEVAMGSLLWPLLSPRLRGEVNGFPYRLTFRRRGGILSAADIGRTFVIWGWNYDLVMDVTWEGRAAFLQESSPAVLLSLLGVTGPPVSHEGLVSYACGSPGGEILASDRKALEHARVATRFGIHGALVRVQSDALRMVNSVPHEVTPQDVVALLEACGGLAACARAVPKS